MRESELAQPKPESNDSKRSTTDPPRSATAAFSRAAVQQAKANASREDIQRRAGFLRRAVAFVIDAALLTVIGAATLAGAGLAYGWADLTAMGHGDPVAGGIALLEQGTYVASAVFLLVFTLATVYFVFFHATLSRTPGKAALGLYVVSDTGLPLRLSQALVRWAAFVLFASLFGLGLLWTAFSEVQEGLHDKLSRTYVRHV